MAVVVADFFADVVERLQRHNIIEKAAKSRNAIAAMTIATIVDVVRADVSGRYDFPTKKRNTQKTKG